MATTNLDTKNLDHNLEAPTATIAEIQRQIARHTVLIYGKGRPPFALCGFTARVFAVFEQLRVRFAFVDIVEHPAFGDALPLYSEWPTFPQVFLQGELIGGCDLTLELHAAGQLLPRLQALQAVGTYTAIDACVAAV
jgi:monothiol glutaredoxin